MVGILKMESFFLVPHVMVKNQRRKPGHEDTDLINKLVSANNHKAYEKLKNIEDLEILPFNKERWSQ